ncbi:MAG: zinc-dependent peptidase [Winogradskyella sp.]|uniref:zinc-dependent peptidase n=1 Tax=Winogradskyella sp. TaxID=1883156 RepID=UPI0025E05F32|nr:zinc-dependent peptidase [Winogradskyella sp.]NRB84179.1 zinc-dependent peptidase [Winogradskyella sp.]
MDPTLKLIFLTIFFIGMALVILSRFYVFFEQRYALRSSKPFFRDFVLRRQDVTKDQESILRREFTFYNKLDQRNKVIFKHRLARFIQRKTFIGRDGIEVTEDMRTLISATAVMLTFGFRNYTLDLFDKIVIYPQPYFSKVNETYHKGEANPMLRTIVLSWEDFERGYHIGDDNLNLGIHEFGHALHLNAFQAGDVSSIIFNHGFNKLMNYLQHNSNVRQELIASKYFRAYAYTNHYEFFAVLLENFIETPLEFKSQFPELYHHMQIMLNFKFAGY